VQQFLVLVQQRLALSRVGDHQRHPRSQLYRRGKSAAARAHDAQLGHAIGGSSAANQAENCIADGSLPHRSRYTAPGAI